MKKGQNTNYQKDAFQTGIGENSVERAIDTVRGWAKQGSGLKRERLNVCRKKKKRK